MSPERRQQEHAASPYRTRFRPQHGQAAKPISATRLSRRIVAHQERFNHVAQIDQLVEAHFERGNGRQVRTVRRQDVKTPQQRVHAVDNGRSGLQAPCDNRIHVRGIEIAG
jgi:hypothetical protein